MKPYLNYLELEKKYPPEILKIIRENRELKYILGYYNSKIEYNELIIDNVKLKCSIDELKLELKRLKKNNKI